MDLWTLDDYKAGTIQCPFPSIRAGHPRLLVTAENKPRIIANMAAVPAVHQALVATAERASTPASFEPMMACAFLHQSGIQPGAKYKHPIQWYRDKAVSELMLLATQPAMMHDNAGRACLDAPCGYDWLHDVLSDGQRQTIATWMSQAFTATYEDSLHPFRYAAWEQNSRYDGLTYALALAGDGYVDQQATDYIARVWQDWWDLEFPTWLELLAEGGEDEGYNYGVTFGFTFGVLACLRSATGFDLVARLPHFFRVADDALVQCAPSTAAECPISLPLGNYWSSVGGSVVWEGALSAMVGWLKDLGEPAMAARARYWSPNPPAAREWWPYSLTCGDCTVHPALDGMPLSRVLPTLGRAFWRSDWSKDAACVTFFSNRFAVQRACGFNHLVVYSHGGPLLVDPSNRSTHGYWETGWDQFHDGYYGFNGPVLWDVGKKIGYRPWRGTMQWGYPLTGGQYDDATFEAKSGVGWEYAKGETGHWFGKGLKPEKIRPELVRREVCYVRPDIVVVLDTIRCGDLLPHLVWNFADQPAIDGGTITVTNTRDYKGLSDRWATIAHGRLEMRTFAEAPLSLVSKGGGEAIYGGFYNEIPIASVPGKEFATAKPLEWKWQGGDWRVHVVPDTVRPQHRIVTVLRISDAASPEPVQASVEFSEIGVHVIIAGKPSLTISASPSFTVTIGEGGIPVAEIQQMLADAQTKLDAALASKQALATAQAALDAAKVDAVAAMDASIVKLQAALALQPALAEALATITAAADQVRSL